MLNSFSVSHATDGKTVCRIFVEPQAKRAGVTVTVDRRIVRMADETNTSFRSVTNAEWSDIAFWESKASTIAKAFSPFWRGESAA
jgi:hypothetical protein